MNDPFEPTPEEKAAGMITRNAVTCGICQEPAHRMQTHFQCSAVPGHVGDLNVGIFSDITREEKP